MMMDGLPTNTIYWGVIGRKKTWFSSSPNTNFPIKNDGNQNGATATIHNRLPLEWKFKVEHLIFLTLHTMIWIFMVKAKD